MVSSGVKTGLIALLAVVAMTLCGFAVMRRLDVQRQEHGSLAAYYARAGLATGAESAPAMKKRLLASILQELDSSHGHASQGVESLSDRIKNHWFQKEGVDASSDESSQDVKEATKSPSSTKKRRRNRRNKKKSENTTSKKRRRNRRNKKKDKSPAKKASSKMAVADTHQQLEVDLREAELTARNAQLQERLEMALQLIKENGVATAGGDGSPDGLPVNAPSTNCTKPGSDGYIPRMLPDGMYPMQPVSDPELQKHIYFLSCMGVDEYDRLVLSKHIIKHFEAMGVLKSNFVLIIQARYNLTGVKEMWRWLEAEGIKPRDVWVGPYSSTDLHAHRLRVLEPLNLTSKDWIVHADQDDFHEYPMPLVQFIGEMNKYEIDVVKGKFVDRFATRDCRALPTMSHESSVFEQFPHCSGNFTKKLVGGNPKKVVLYRGNLRTNRGGHKITNLDEHIVELMRNPDRTNTSQARALNAYGGGPLVHHMKWSSSVLARLIDRKVRYKLRDGHNGTHWREAARAIAFFTRDYEELADEGLNDNSFSWAKASTELCDEWVAERRRLTEKALAEVEKELFEELNTETDSALNEDDVLGDEDDDELDYEDDEEDDEDEDEDEEDDEEEEEEAAAIREWMERRRKQKKKRAASKRRKATRPRRSKRVRGRSARGTKKSAGRL